MPSINLETYEEAVALNTRITNACIDSGKWQGGTNNYCIPYQDESNGMWIVPILEGYEEFFTSFELSIADQNMNPIVKEVLQDKWFCKSMQVKLLAALKSSTTLTIENYRQMSDLFWYAKDAADNGNPTNLKMELLALPDEATLGLSGWDELKASLVSDIDNYLA